MNERRYCLNVVTSVTDTDYQPLGCCVGLHQKSKFVYKYPIGCCVGLHQKSKFVHKYPEITFNFNRPKIVSIYLFTFFIFIHRIRSYLQTWRDHSGPCAALFSHGTTVVMFSRKCSAGNFISKMGRDPKREKKKKKKKKHGLKWSWSQRSRYRPKFQSSFLYQGYNANLKIQVTRPYFVTWKFFAILCLNLEVN